MYIREARPRALIFSLYDIYAASMNEPQERERDDCRNSRCVFLGDVDYFNKNYRRIVKIREPSRSLALARPVTGNNKHVCDMIGCRLSARARARSPPRRVVCIALLRLRCV